MKSQTASPLRRKWNQYKVGTILFAPFFLLFALFVVVPVVEAVGLSFTNYDMVQTPRFLGFNNYKLLFMDDDIFLQIGRAHV